MMASGCQSFDDSHRIIINTKQNDDIIQGIVIIQEETSSIYTPPYPCLKKLYFRFESIELQERGHNYRQRPDLYSWWYEHYLDHIQNK